MIEGMAGVRKRWSGAAALSGAAVFFALAADPSPPAPQPLGEGAWWIPGGFLPKRQPDGNTVVLQGPEGLVVLDTGRHAWHRQAILDLARARGAPVAAIVNSHWHLDHVSGNPALKAAFPKATVYASGAIDGALEGFLRSSAEGARKFLATPGLAPETAEDIRGDLASVANGRALRPDVVIGANATMRLAGRPIAVHLSRDGPTAGDVWLVDPALGLAAVGDLVTLPVPFLDTACVDGWRAALAEVEATPFETLVPGHGRPMSRAEFKLYRRAFDAFVACAASDAAPATCATGWTRDAAPLLAANGQDAKRAEAMATYYVRDVLRHGKGDSPHCRH